MNGYFYNKNVLITGGSSGIGLAVAKEFAKKGAHLFLLARNADRLAKAKFLLGELYPEVRVVCLPVDVGDAKGMAKEIARIGDNYGEIHVLVNNAGLSGVRKIEDSNLKAMKRLMEVNYWGSVYATQSALPYLKKAKKSHVAFVSSVAGFLGAYGYGEYAPTKFAMTGFAECFRMEGQPYGIETTIIFPPDTDTPMWEWEQANNQPESKALSKNAKLVGPDWVAKRLVRGMEKGKFEVFCNFESKGIRWIKYLMPRLYFKILDAIVANDRKKRSKAD